MELTFNARRFRLAQNATNACTLLQSGLTFHAKMTFIIERPSEYLGHKNGI